jgi:hypothetical protein
LAANIKRVIETGVTTFRVLMIVESLYLSLSLFSVSKDFGENEL